MPRKSTTAVKEKNLTKGQLRKLTALRKSLGNDIADRAFAEWLAQQPDEAAVEDPNAAMIAERLTKLAVAGKLRIPRGGYLVRRGRGRVIVTPPE
jgi:hypothetical protein